MFPNVADNQILSMTAVEDNLDPANFVVFVDPGTALTTSAGVISTLTSGGTIVATSDAAFTFTLTQSSAIISSAETNAFLTTPASANPQTEYQLTSPLPVNLTYQLITGTPITFSIDSVCYSIEDASATYTVTGDATGLSWGLSTTTPDSYG